MSEINAIHNADNTVSMELSEFNRLVSENATISAEVAAQREVIVSTADMVAQRDGEIRKLRADIAEAVGLLRRVMGWIENWEPNFTEDDEWLDIDEPKISAFLSRLDQTNCPHISTSGDDMSEPMSGHEMDKTGPDKVQDVAE